MTADCPACDGYGYFTDLPGNHPDAREMCCDECNGTGEVCTTDEDTLSVVRGVCALSAAVGDEERALRLWNLFVENKVS